ncbi:hypothetical protein FACS189481_2600 [Clostridia bacterium]|nr:hypothetical protein FACS189481_2600 [Clostridia bacterium]
MPSVKLRSKRREGAKIIKHYDKPTTPYRRLLASKDISQTAKNKLTEQYKKLNPAQLKRDMINLFLATIAVQFVIDELAAIV